MPLSTQSKSLISVPLIVFEECYGILIIESNVPNSFSYLDKQILKQFGNAMAIAMHNNRDHRQKLKIMELTEKKKQYEENISALNAMAHQFKTPLHWIQLTASSLGENLKTKSIQDIKNGLDDIYNYSNSAEDMIRRILLNYKDVEVETNLSEIFDKVRSTYSGIGHEGIVIGWPTDSLDTILKNCKINQIRFVIDTIIQNSIDAIKEKRVKDGKITIKSSILDGNLKLEFTDNGQGIKMQYHDKIFNNIFSTKPDDIGNGIGLFLCKTFVEGHQGVISFTSKPGNTRFTVTLPLRMTEENIK